MDLASVVHSLAKAITSSSVLGDEVLVVQERVCDASSAKILHYFAKRRAKAKGKRIVTAITIFGLKYVLSIDNLDSFCGSSDQMCSLATAVQLGTYISIYLYLQLADL
mmetsp:Transcript_25385/g.74724  ORF Transcript_25385/g.74724 Transcript_25385/m.74724 type:complete len:108 (+) Transcript_25385:1027-1350(+)